MHGLMIDIISLKFWVHMLCPLRRRNTALFVCIFSHLPAECTLWQGCCRRQGRLQCRQPPGSGIGSRWSDLLADSSWSRGCWCSSPGSPLAVLPDGTYTHTNKHTQVRKVGKWFNTSQNQLWNVLPSRVGARNTSWLNFLFLLYFVLL